jgi:hypothetical protein
MNSKESPEREGTPRYNVREILVITFTASAPASDTHY